MTQRTGPQGDGTKVSTPGPVLAETDLLTVAGVGKRFGGAIVLEGISFSLRLGQSLGVVGENGAGKSTLMKILGGVYPTGSYDGSFALRGEDMSFRSVQDARNAGVVLIPQELHIAPALPIAENMFAGALPSKAGLVSFGELSTRATRWLRFFDLAVDSAQPASILSPSEQRLILIAGALSLDARVLILDEPTASLSDGEAQSLFAHLRKLRDQGIGILFISHRLDDIAEVCDELIVLRNGQMIDRFDAKASRSDVIAAMIGRPASAIVGPRDRDDSTDVVLQVRDFVVRDAIDSERLRVDHISFDVHKGEVLGLFGLVGAGRTEVLRAIFGTWPRTPEGNIELQGRPYRPKDPASAIRRQIGLLTEDRKQSGIFPGHSLTSNFDAASPKQVAKFGFVRTTLDNERARQLIKMLDVRARSASQHIETLSGGNQQKALLGRWIATKPVLLLLDEPTAGVDVGAREDIYVEIEGLADLGCAILLVSSDLDEIIRLADRTKVMYKGKLVSDHGAAPTRHELMAAATGGIQ